MNLFIKDHTKVYNHSFFTILIMEWKKW